MKPKDLGGHISATYRTLRLGIAAIAFAFPLLLWLGGHVAADMSLKGSMSAYYHAASDELSGSEPGKGAMRDVFVGVLVAVGTILFLYQGITRLEDHALNLAGILALGVAFFPMGWPPDKADDGTFSMHGLCAVAFFLCIAYVCVFRACDTLPMIEDEAKRAWFRRWYKGLGWAMPLSPLAAWLMTSFAGWKGALVFFVEAFGVYVFATYWLIKSREIALINASGRNVARRFRAEPAALSDIFKQVQVAPVDGPGAGADH